MFVDCHSSTSFMSGVGYMWTQCWPPLSQAHYKPIGTACNHDLGSEMAVIVSRGGQAFFPWATPSAGPLDVRPFRSATPSPTTLRQNLTCHHVATMRLRNKPRMGPLSLARPRPYARQPPHGLDGRRVSCPRTTNQRVDERGNGGAGNRWFPPVQRSMRWSFVGATVCILAGGACTSRGTAKKSRPLLAPLVTPGSSIGDGEGRWLPLGQASLFARGLR